MQQIIWFNTFSRIMSRKNSHFDKFNEEKLRCKFNVTFETFDDAPRSQLIFETFNYLLPETKKTLKPEKELTLMIISLRVREILKLSMSMFIS